MIESSIYFFSKAYLGHPRSYYPGYALSVSLHRIKEYKKSLEFAWECMKLDIDDKDIVQNLIFLQALNYKQLRMYEQASERYFKFLEITEQYKKYVEPQLKQWVWGLIALPMIDDRKKLCTLVEGFQNLLHYFSVENPKELSNNLYNYIKNEWNYSKDALKFIKQRKFFNCFTEQQIKNSLFKFIEDKGKYKWKVKLQEYSENEIIYFKETIASIVLSGDIILFSHESDITPGECMAKFKEGDVLASQYNTDLWRKEENWCITRTKTLLAQVEYEDLKKLMASKYSPKEEISIKVKHNYPILSMLSEITKFRLLNYAETHTFKRGELLCPQNK